MTMVTNMKHTHHRTYNNHSNHSEDRETRPSLNKFTKAYTPKLILFERVGTGRSTLKMPCRMQCGSLVLNASVTAAGASCRLPRTAAHTPKYTQESL